MVVALEALSFDRHAKSKVNSSLAEAEHMASLPPWH